MSHSETVVVPTGTANLASVMAAFRRLGTSMVEATTAEAVAGARRVVLPGVGTFGSAMDRLTRLGVVEALRERIRGDRPTLAICVGMQVISGSSEESPGSPGLALVDVPVTRFPEDLIVPQLSWGPVTPGPGSVLIVPGWAYFANSYRFEETPRGWQGSTAAYGSPFVAAMERGKLLACQFHPELSGEWGSSLLARWLEAS